VTELRVTLAIVHTKGDMEISGDCGEETMEEMEQGWILLVS
jgi:hypothetical protein